MFRGSSRWRPDNDNGCKRAWISICNCLIMTFATALVISGIILLTAKSPKISLLALQLPVHNNNILTFKLKVYNPNFNVLIHFSDFNTSFRYPFNHSSTTASLIVPAEYYQRGRKTVVKVGNGTTTSSFNFTEDEGGKIIGVYVNGRVKYNSWLINSKWSGLSVRGVAEVDTQGYFASENGLKLESSATMSLPDIALYLLLLLVVHTCC